LKRSGDEIVEKNLSRLTIHEYGEILFQTEI
jgi:hypothetical protein